MARPKKPPKSLQEQLLRLLARGETIVESDKNDGLPSLEERKAQIEKMVYQPHKEAGCMLFFVMYDIESNKVRRLVVKYLERKGCMRVQKSIFLAELPTPVYETIKKDLAQVQQAYCNNDSILIVPISTDYLQAMKIIGQNINLDLITRSKTTLFF